MNWRRIALAGAGLAALAGAAGLAGGPRTPRLVAGTCADFPPFESRVDGRIVGFDLEIAGGIAARAGRELRVRDLEFSELLPALERGAVDLVVAALAPTAERRAAADFSEPYYRATPVALARKAAGAPAAKAELAGRRIGAVLGTAGIGVAATLTADGNIRPALSALGAVADLMNGEVDAAILDEEAAARFEQKNPELRRIALGAGEEAYAVAVRRGDAELRATVNAALAEMAADGRRDRFADRWLVRAPEPE